MSKDPDDAASSMGEAGTLYVAAKASRKSIVAGVGDLEDPGSVGMHKPAPADTESFLGEGREGLCEGSTVRFRCRRPARPVAKVSGRTGGWVGMRGKSMLPCVIRRAPRWRARMRKRRRIGFKPSGWCAL